MQQRLRDDLSFSIRSVQGCFCRKVFFFLILDECYTGHIVSTKYTLVFRYSGGCKQRRKNDQTYFVLTPFVLLYLAKDHGRGFSTRNAHMVHFINSIRFTLVYTS